METRLFNRQQLREFIFSDEFNNLPFIPISRHRALSQISNPRAEDSDILLAAVFDNHLLAGYLGVLPDCLFLHHEPVRVGWLSCFWVDENRRSEPIAGTLFLHIMEAWNNRILITNFEPSLTRLYQRSRMFNPVMVKTGIRAYLRMNLSEILPPKAKIFNTLKPLFVTLDTIFNVLADTRFYLLSRDSHKDAYQIFDVPDEDACDHISLNAVNTWPQRGPNELLWIIRNPWIIEKDQKDQESKRYYFTSVARQFTNKFIVIRKQSQGISAVVMVNIRNKHVTVPYIFAETESLSTIAEILSAYMIKHKLNMLTSFNEPLCGAIKRVRKGFLYKKSILRHYFVSRKLDFVDSLNFQDGDGDCVFY